VNKLSFVTLAFLAGVGCAVACSSSGDDTSAPGGGSGGSAGKASGGSGGTSSSTAGKGGTSSTAGTASSVAGANEGGASSIYEDLGEEAGITKAVDAIVAAEVMDADIASYFSQQADSSHSPTVDDIKECLVIQLAGATGGPQVYAGHKTSAGFACRDMKTAHADLNINSGTFTKFVSIAANVLQSDPFNVPANDLATIGTVLLGLQKSIVTANPDSNTERPCTAPAACALGAGGAAGAGGSN